MEDGRALTDALTEQFDAAVAGTPLRRRLRIGRLAVTLSCADDAPLELFRPPLRHLESSLASDGPGLEICCFAAPRSPAAWLEAHELPCRINETIVLGSFRYCFQGHTLFAFDAAAGHAFYWAADAADFAHYRARPLTRLLAWFGEHHGLTWVHAACVGTDRGGVVIPAAGGSGKSTVAVAALLAGMSFAGDDFALLDTARDPGNDTVLGVYGNTMLSAESIALLQALPHADKLVPAFPDKKNKFCYPLYDRFSAQLTAEAPLAAILVPEVTGGASSIEEASPRDAVRSFVSSVQIGSILGLDPKSILRAVHGLSQRVPLGRLEIGRDLASIPPLLDSFIEKYVLNET